ncbi:MAG: nucleoside triphosphate pyrophosphohydrolase [Firmicutes bacterium]|nr:nucleoside triphosphate pyrophosphohydrolase [Bacillota bacterium]
MPELYLIGLGKGEANSLKILEQPEFSGISTCIFHSASPHLKELLRKMGLRVINLAEAIKNSPECSLKDLHKKTVGLVWNVLEKEEKAALFLPGRPWAGEATVKILSSQMPDKVSLHVIKGNDIGGPILDFLDREMSTDFSRGISFHDAHFLEDLLDPPRSQLIITHPCNKFLIFNIKRILSGFYPPEHNINILQFDHKGLLTLLKVQPLGQIEKAGAFNCWTFFHLTPSPYHSFGDMASVMKQLRTPEGCPWDRQQDHFSLKPYLLEEAYEVVEAINRKNPGELCEELGDLLLQVIFHSELAREKGDFSLWQVIDGLTRKIYRRHPHVFGDAQISDATGVKVKWEEIKQQEKGREKTDLFATPEVLPALMRAQKIQKKAAVLGFDWPDISGAAGKLYEEIEELQAAYAQKHREKIEEELGDVFFALVNMARFLKVDAETALHSTIEKFIRRFRYIEKQVQLRGGDYSSFTLKELDNWWQEAKNQEN